MRFMHRFRRHLGAVQRVMGVLLLLAGLLILAGPVHDEVRFAMPGLVKSGAFLALPLSILGLVLALGAGGWLARRLTGEELPHDRDRVVVLCGVVVLALGLFIGGGSMNVLGQWLLDNFPALASLEEWMTSRSLQGEIMRRGGGQ